MDAIVSSVCSVHSVACERATRASTWASPSNNGMVSAKFVRCAGEILELDQCLCAEEANLEPVGVF